MRVLDERVAARRRNLDFYRSNLGEVQGIEFAPEAPYGGRNAWLTCILVDEEKFGVGPEKIREHLAAHQIEARPLWKPMHLQPVFQKHRCVGGEISSDLFRRGLSLPSGSNLSESDLRRVVDAVLASAS